jgi:hypothetical protein
MSARRPADEWRWVGPDGFEYSGSKEKLCDALSTGRLAPSTPVWKAGFRSWLSAETVPELAEEISGASLPAYALEPAMKTPPPIGISADAVVVAPPGADMKIVAPAHAPQPPGPQPGPRPKTGGLWWLALLLPALGGLLVLGLLWGFGVFAGSKAEESRSAPAVASGSAEVAALASPLVCTMARSKRIAKTVYGKVPIAISAFQSGLGVGFAETRSLARAAVLNPETLAVEQQKGANSAAAVVGSSAFERDGQLDLIVDVDDGRLRLARTFAPSSSLKIGLAQDGIATLDHTGQRRTIWKSDANAEYTLPRVDGSATRGHFVALRRGGLGGKLLGGWLAPDGTARSELTIIEVQSAQVGTPTAAVGASGVLMAAAARTSDQEPWEVMVGTASQGKAPEQLKALAFVRSPETQRMSPAAAALPDGRWALQFTERTASGHVVRLALLDSKLEPLTDPVTVSPEAAESGQGELWASGDRVVSLYLVKAGAGHELWGSVIACK